MNAGFEDIRILVEILDRAEFEADDEADRKHILAHALKTFSETRCPDAWAICDLALENYHEMSHDVLSLGYLLHKKVIGWLHRCFPRIFIPQYTMVSFTLIPYAEIIRRRDWQRSVLTWTATLATTCLSALMVFAFLKRR